METNGRLDRLAYRSELNRN